MADVTVTYNGSDIVELSESGQKTLNTQGTYCSGNIGLTYVKPQGGSDLANVDVYICNYATDTVDITTGAKDAYRRVIVGG